MTLTDVQLRDNYFFACAYVAGLPYKYTRTDFKVRDNGGSSVPTPYISSWTVNGVTQPTDEYMKANLTMIHIAAVAAAITYL